MTEHLLDAPKPTVLDGLTFASARDQAQAFAEGRVTAIDLLEHSLARIECFDRDTHPLGQVYGGFLAPPGYEAVPAR